MKKGCGLGGLEDGPFYLMDDWEEKVLMDF